MIPRIFKMGRYLPDVYVLYYVLDFVEVHWKRKELQMKKTFQNIKNRYLHILRSPFLIKI